MRPQKRISAQGHVCFTPESGHVRCSFEKVQKAVKNRMAA